MLRKLWREPSACGHVWRRVTRASARSLSQSNEDEPENEAPRASSLALRSWLEYLFGGQLAPYVSSTSEAVHKMLRLADVGPPDVVFDLGSGDGRIVTAAAKRGAQQAVGFELDSELMRQASWHVATLKSEVSQRIELRAQDVLSAPDLSDASVFCCFLSQSGNSKLLPLLREHARDDSRLVSFNFRFPGISPSVVDSVDRVDIYLYNDFGRLAREQHNQENKNAKS